MDVHRKPNGRWEVRWREGTRRRGRTFDRKTDAVNFIAYQRRRQQLGQPPFQTTFRFVSS